MTLVMLPGWLPVGRSICLNYSRVYPNSEAWSAGGNAPSFAKESGLSGAPVVLVGIVTCRRAAGSPGFVQGLLVVR